jgi:hypothetical protein
VDLKERFDQALDGGPPHAPIEARLIAGRRAVRRRRTAMGATARVMLTIVGGIGWAGVPGTGSAVDQSRIPDRTEAATSTPSSPTTSKAAIPAEIPPILDYDLDSGHLTTVISSDTSSGKMATAAGIVIERYLDNPVEPTGSCRPLPW